MTTKRPNGKVVEEFLTTGTHLFENGKLADHCLPENGMYTGVFWFEYLDGKTTRRYTRNTAPAWLLAMYLEATGVE